MKNRPNKIIIMRCCRIYTSIVVTVLAAFGLSACRDDYDLLETTSSSIVELSPFTRAALDTMTVSDFRRSYGVGFSYDGIWGERCNLRDIHSRVLNLEAIRNWENEADWHLPLFDSNAESDFTYEVTTAYSQSNYVQSTVARASAKAQMIIFKGEFAGRLTLWEGGRVNDFHCSVIYRSPTMKMALKKGNLRSLIRQGNTDLLTPNFREAIAWIGKNPIDATVDSFLVCYGSHVVTSSKVGGSLEIEMTMKRDSLLDVISNEVIVSAVVDYLLKAKLEYEDIKKELYLLNSADCSITVKGGDLSAIPNELLHFRFGDRPLLSQYVNRWVESLNYNSTNYIDNNLEMTDMEVTPIWEFIPDDFVANLVKMRVEGTAKELILSNGYQNFTNTSFQLPESVTCQMGGQSTTFNQPAVCNVLAAGRYVATICREQIDLPEVGMKEVQVVYPIYNQQVNLSCGYTTYGDAAYNVCWLKGNCTVEKDTVNTPSPDGTIYMTYGVPGSVQFANVKYQPCYTVIGYEWPLSITKEGMVDMSKPYYLTYKNGADFLLRTTDDQEQSGNLEGLPNWTFRDGRMVRNKEYYYYWNPNEVSY